MQLVTVLPKGIADAINSAAKNQNQANKLTKLIKYILGKYIADGIDFDTEIEISQLHYKKQVSERYLNELKILKAAGIVQSSEKYTPPKRNSKTAKQLTKGQCKKYQLNRDLVFSDPELVTYNETAKKLFDQSFVVSKTVSLLSRLTLEIDYRNLKRFIQNLVTNEHILSRCKINEQIPTGVYHVKCSKHPLSLDRIQDIANRSNLDVIFYRDKIHLANLKIWLDNRVKQTRAVYLDSLIKLKTIRQRPNIYCKRNDTNQRLDTNLTNLKSEFIQHLRLDGERLVSIDLKNSQFAILSKLIEICENFYKTIDNEQLNKKGMQLNFNIIDEIETAKFGFANLWHYFNNLDKKYSYQHIIEDIPLINVLHFCEKNGSKTGVNNCKSNDLERFKKCAKQGRFYDDFQQILEGEGQYLTRDEIKKMMFLLLFSARGYNPKEKRILAKHLPSLVYFADEFKRISADKFTRDGLNSQDAKDRGNANLAVTLQRIESVIFIDCILSRLLKSGYRVFTKHDSILCKESDLRAVELIVRDELDKELGINSYQLKIDLA